MKPFFYLYVNINEYIYHLPEQFKDIKIIIIFLMTLLILSTMSVIGLGM